MAVSFAGVIDVVSSAGQGSKGGRWRKRRRELKDLFGLQSFELTRQWNLPLVPFIY